MQNQEVFDKVVAHLRQQKKKSIYTYEVYDGKTCTSCAYRGDNGLKCAAGIFIPDEDYVVDMENTPISSSRIFPVLKRQNINFDLLKSLQIVHDGFEPYEWETRLHDVAKKFNLNYQAP